MHWAPTLLLKLLCFTIDHLFLEEGAMKDYFPFVHIPKALNMMPAQIYGAVWNANEFSCPSVIYPSRNSHSKLRTDAPYFTKNKLYLQRDTCSNHHLPYFSSGWSAKFINFATYKSSSIRPQSKSPPRKELFCRVFCTFNPRAICRVMTCIHKLKSLWRHPFLQYFIELA